MDALEAVDCVPESAAHLLLETDAAARQPRDHYLMRYQEMALGQVESALERVQKLKDDLGPEAATKLWKEDRDLAIAAAETMVARDNLKASLKETRRRLLHNQITCNDDY